MMRKLLYSFLFFIFLHTAGFGQTAGNYCFVPSTATYTNLTGFTTAPGIPTTATDDVISSSITMPFNFLFGGTAYNQLKISNNGWITFGVTTNSYYDNNSNNARDARPIIFPFWDDLVHSANLAPRYLIDGSAGSRIFKIEWIQQYFFTGNNGDVISFQVWLYEGSNKIEFRYRQGTINPGNNVISASIGIYDASQNYITLNGAGNNPTAQTGTFTNNINSRPATGQMYTFTPPSSITNMTNTACSGASFTSIPVNGTNGSVPVGTIYSWSAPTVTGGMRGGISGSGESSVTGTLNNYSTTNQTATYTVTPVSGGCTGNTFTVTVTVRPSEINNKITFDSGTSGQSCGEAAEGGTAVLNAPAGTYFNTVSFASYGLPNGSCGSYTIGTDCHSPVSQSVSEATLLGNSTGSITANNETFSDACVGTGKRLRISSRYSQPICSGNIPGVVSGTGISGASYLWEVSTTSATNSFGNAPGTNTNQNYTPTVALAADTWFRRRVTLNGCVNYSAVVLIKVNPASVGGSIAGSTSVCTGTNSTVLTLSGHTGSITRWESSLDNFASAGTAIPGTANATTYTAANLTATTSYRAVLTSGVCLSANSTVATVTVNPVSVGGSIGGSTTVCAGTNSTVLTLSGYTGSITRWESSLNNFSSAGTAIPGTANATTYTAANLTATTSYRAVLTSGVCSAANSNVATVTVNPASVGGSIAGSTSVCTGTNSTVLTLSGHTGSITRWESSLDNFASAGTAIPGTANATTYTAANLTATTSYRAVLTSGVCLSANSSVAIVTVNPVSVGGSIGGSTTVCAGTNSTVLTLSGYTGSITRWESSLDNFASAGTAISGTANATTYTAANLTATTSYRAVLTSGVCSAANSSIATVTVNPLPTASNAGADQYGGSTFTLAANAPTVGTATWTIASGPNTSVSQFSNVSSPTSTFTPLTPGTYALNWTISNSCNTSTDQVVVSNCVGNLIKNGDFSLNGTNWTSAASLGDRVEINEETTYFSTGRNDKTAELDSEASLSQAVTVIPNVPYTLSFLYAKRIGAPATVAVYVKITGGSFSATTNYTSSNEGIPQTVSFPFTPTSSSITIEFYNPQNPGATYGSIIDNIVLVPSSQVTPIATTSPKGVFKTLKACASVPIQLDVENVPASGVTYAWSSTSGGVFSSATIKNPTVTFTGTGSKEATVIVTTVGGCSGAPSTTYFNIQPLPTVYNVTGGSGCSSGAGITVGLSGSTSGVSYQLQLNGVNSGTPITGTGAAFNFGSKTAAGTYTIVAKNPSPNDCSVNMSGSAIIYPAATLSLTSVTGTASQTVCSGAAITNIVYTYGGGATGVNVTGLPTGLVANVDTATNTVTISGTSTANVTYNVATTGQTSPCNAVSLGGTITVNPNLPASVSIGASTSTTICSGTSVTFTATPTNGGGAPSYQWKVNGVNAGTNSATYTTTSLVNGDQVSCVMTSNATPCSTGSPATSNTLTITVNSIQNKPSIGTITNVTCLSQGSVILGNVPSSGSFQINQTGDTSRSITVPSSTGSTYTVSGLAAGTYYFTVQTAITCVSPQSDPVTITDQSSTTWNGSGWSHGAPDSSKSVIIASTAGNPFPTNIEACSLTITVPSGPTDLPVIVKDGITLTITNAVTSNGKLLFESGSNLVQKTDVQNTGEIIYQRKATVARYDLTYWGMPVAKPGFTMKMFSPNTLIDKYFILEPSNASWVENYNGTFPMIAGKGYSIRAPQSFPSPTKQEFIGTFEGIPNNGDIPVTVVSGKWNLIGNPYPSSINAEKFRDDNPGIGALYFWAHVNLPVKSSTDQFYYYTDDFVVYNGLGSVDTGEANYFKGQIGAAQGFIVKAPTATVNFNNSQRNGGNNSQFYKTAQSTIEKNRVWLNLKNTEGIFKQILLGYTTGATNALDVDFDALSMASNPVVDFYSIGTAKKLTIQGRALPFVKSDVVPLGYLIANKGDYTISIDHADGLFNEGQDVFLEDKTNGKITNLRLENYKFTTAAGTFNNRFAIRYTSATLGVDDVEGLEDSVLVSVKNREVKITSSNETIKEVNIFDIGAQLIYTKNNVNSSELQISNLQSSDQALLVKITLENGYTFTKKIIFSNL